MNAKDFDYFLDDSLIANYPVEPRDSAKLMVINNEEIKHQHFYDVIDYLNPGDALVLNSSKVINARILFEKKEIFLLKRIGNGVWNCMVRPGKFFKEGLKFKIGEEVEAEVLERLEDGTRNIYFDNELEALKLGKVPLPPYINNLNVKEEDYQTVYADLEGSVAAPTAGLHFTEELLEKIKKKGVKIVTVILHVGRGTFLPVTAEKIEDHVMHEEEYFISEKSANEMNEVIAAGGRIVAVGTTTVRVLESCFADGKFEEKNGFTDIFIYPGNYQWKVVDVLITNFHLPKSTLLMLVSSFLEKKGFKKPVSDLMKIYQEAIERKYRFYSFGDAMIIF